MFELNSVILKVFYNYFHKIQIQPPEGSEHAAFNNGGF